MTTSLVIENSVVKFISSKHSDHLKVFKNNIELTDYCNFVQDIKYVKQGRHTGDFEVVAG
jgi:hypothetical protein